MVSLGRHLRPLLTAIHRLSLDADRCCLRPPKCIYRTSLVGPFRPRPPAQSRPTGPLPPFCPSEGNPGASRMGQQNTSNPLSPSKLCDSPPHNGHRHVRARGEGGSLLKANNSYLQWRPRILFNVHLASCSLDGGDSGRARHELLTSYLSLPAGLATNSS